MALCQRSFAKEAFLGHDNDESVEATPVMDAWRMAPCFFDRRRIASGTPFNTAALKGKSKRPVTCSPCAENETPTTESQTPTSVWALQPLSELIENGHLDPAKLRADGWNPEDVVVELREQVNACMSESELKKTGGADKMTGAACRGWLLRALDTLESGDSCCHVFER